MMNGNIFKDMTSKLSQAGKLTSTEYAPTAVGASLSSVIWRKRIKVHRHYSCLIISNIRPKTILSQPP